MGNNNSNNGAVQFLVPVGALQHHEPLSQRPAGFLSVIIVWPPVWPFGRLLLPHEASPGLLCHLLPSAVKLPKIQGVEKFRVGTSWYGKVRLRNLT